MNEREQADALARTIDELIQGTQTEDPASRDEAVRFLTNIADARRQAGIEAGQRSADHQSAVWQRLTDRLESSEDVPDSETGDARPNDEMHDIVTARKRVSEDIHELAERHREDVWRRIQEKIGSRRPRKRGLFSFLPIQDVRLSAQGIDAAASPPTGPAALQLATARQAARGLSETKYQLRERMRLDPVNRPPSNEPERGKPRRGFWLQGGAVVALALGAIVLAPLPISGVEGSPAIAAARSALEHLGVTETATSPPTPGSPASTSGTESSLAEAASRLGLPLVAPAEIMGYPMTSQIFFSQGLTGAGSGTFAVAYAGDAASPVIYEEAGGGSEFAVPEGAAVDTLVNGLPATYFEGGWSEGNDGLLSWQPVGTQTLVFEQSGVRFTVVYSGQKTEPADLAIAAGSIR